jgi:transketolase
LPTLKPLDIEAIINLGKTTKKLVTIEEHNIIGGLYSAVSEVLCKYYPIHIYPIAVPDEFTESGLPYDLLKKYKLDFKNIINKIIEISQQQ